MKEQLITQQVAELAREKKFNAFATSYYKIKSNGVVELITNSLHCNDTSALYPASSTAPAQSLLQKWLRGKDVIIDMFYEDGMWSGRVFKLNDEQQRWKSGSTSTYEDTLEMMLAIGLELI